MLKVFICCMKHCHISDIDIAKTLQHNAFFFIITTNKLREYFSKCVHIRRNIKQDNKNFFQLCCKDFELYQKSKYYE